MNLFGWGSTSPNSNCPPQNHPQETHPWVHPKQTYQVETVAFKQATAEADKNFVSNIKEALVKFRNNNSKV